MLRFFLTLAIAACLLNPQACKADVVFDESADGEASGDVDAPTDLGTLLIGEHEIIGALDNFNNFPQDIDAFTFHIPNGQQLDAIILEEIDGDLHFFGLDDGTTIEQDAANLLVATLISASMTGVNLLDPMEAPPMFGNTGVTPPLGSGDYSIQLQENDIDVFHPYILSIQTSAVAVPEPTSTVILAALSMGVMTVRRRRR